jgi:hypothetical protein
VVDGENDIPLDGLLAAAYPTSRSGTIVNLSLSLLAVTGASAVEVVRFG